MNVTQLLGIVSFGVAGLLCMWVRRSPWTALGFLSLLFCLECVLNFRHQFHDAIIKVIGSLYLERAPYQMALIGGGLVLGAILIVILLRVVDDNLTRLAMAATVAGGALFAVETISLHEVDRVLYQPVGSAKLIAWIWLGLSVVVGSAAVISRLRQRDS
ncbi:MAG: hypothetical protein AAFQ13_04400 [Pseudomonadota bacterium]